MLLTGTYVRSVDEKQRIALPKRIREALEESATEGTKSQPLYLTLGNDNSLALYTEGVLEGMAQRLAAVSPTRQDVRAFNRLFYAQAERLELDDQGRFRVPPHLAQLAALGKEVALIGVQDHLEIWNKPRWDEYLAARSAEYDRIAEQAFDDGRLRKS